jgi:hypothetical protein
LDLSVVLLHDQMVDRQGHHVTTSITLIDVHDIARSARTYGLTNYFISHPSPHLRGLVRTMQIHWDEGFGATYNPNRKEALARVELVCTLDEAIAKIDLRTGKLPKLIATSAKGGGRRVTFSEMRRELHDTEDPYLLMLGTGWGMSDELLARADLFLEPVYGPTNYNHLSVRSACAIMLDRLASPQRDREGGT